MLVEDLYLLDSRVLFFKTSSLERMSWSKFVEDLYLHDFRFHFFETLTTLLPFFIFSLSLVISLSLALNGKKRVIKNNARRYVLTEVLYQIVSCVLYEIIIVEE